MTKKRICSYLTILFFLIMNLNFVCHTVSAEAIDFDLNFNTGWNYITIPIENAFMASTLAENISGCSSVNKWDAVNQTYRTYIVGGPPSMNFEISDGYGISVDVSTSSTLTISGDQLDDVTIDLYSGWNFLGWYLPESTNASTLFNSIGGCTQIRIWDSQTQSYVYYNSSGDPDFAISQGMGYIVDIATVDSSSPTTSCSLSGTYENNVYKSNVTVSLSWSDNSNAVIYTKYRVDSGSWQKYTSSITVSSDGFHVLEYYSVDYSNNVENTKSTSFTIQKTQTQETLNIDAPNSVNEKETFQIIITSQGLSIQGANVNVFEKNYLTDANGLVSITAPTVNEDTTYQITASKSGYMTDSETITVLNVVQILPSITLLSPVGGEIWSNTRNIVWIIENNPVGGNAVTIQYKVSNGDWNTIVSDYNDVTTPYPWDTTKMENGNQYKVKVILKYDSNSDGIYETTQDEDGLVNYFTIENIEITNGWINGTVYENVNQINQPIENVKVCAKIIEDNIIRSICTFTDQNGKYSLKVPPENYIVTAEKNEYQKETKTNINVISNQETVTDFTLQRIIEETTTSIIDYTIQKEIETGQITVEIDTSKDQTDVELYDDSINVKINKPLSENSIFSFDISATEETPGTKVVLYLGLVDQEKVQIEYDGEIIKKTDDIQSFFLNNNENIEYALFSSDNVVIAVVNIPSFSEHTINIYLISAQQVIKYTWLIIVSAIAIIFLAAAFMVRKGKE